MLPWLRNGMVILLMSTLAACGGGGGGGGAQGFSLTASSTGIKSVTFTWQAFPGAAFYRLFINPDGVSGYSQVGSDTTDTRMVVQVPVHLTDWLNVRYLVEAYDTGGEKIATSRTAGIEALMLNSIGYAKASNTASNDGFGYRVEVSGDGNTMAVSALGEDSAATGIDGNQSSDSATDSGAVYLFVRTGGTWVQQAYIKASNTRAFDAFGSSLALNDDGTTLAVGAINEDSPTTGINGNQSADTATNSGAVYLFTRNGTLWSQQAYIKASNTGISDNFGGSVSLSSDGNTLAVGATGEDSDSTGVNNSEVTGNAPDAGAVYLFTREGTSWSQQAYIKASNTETGDGFGGSVVLGADGSTLAVAATGEDSASTGINNSQFADDAPDSGAIYLFVRSAGTWSQQAYIKASNTEVGDAFGSSIALSGHGNTLAVGAVGEDSLSTGIDNSQFFDFATNSGAVYLFTRSADIWSQQAYIKAANTDSLDGFGASVALNGNGEILAVGANLEDGGTIGMDGNLLDNDASDSGAVYLYTGTAGIWSPFSYAKAPNTDIFDQFGANIAMSADGNTLVIGATGEDSLVTGISGDMGNNEALNSGAVYLY